MPLEIKIDVILPKGDYPRGQWKQFDRNLQLYMKGELSKAIEDDYKRTIRGWKTKVVFKGEFSKSRRDYTLEVVPKGPGASIYGYVDAGTRSRTIGPKRAPALVFQRDYSPKTRKGGRTGGTGKRSGPWIRTQKVSGHKIEAREFTEEIAKKIEKKVVTDVHKMVLETFKGVR